MNVQRVACEREIEKPRHRLETLPFYPAFDGYLVEVRERARRQFHVASIAIKFEDASGRGGLGGNLEDRKQDQHDGAQKYAAIFLVRCLHAGDSATKPAARKAPKLEDFNAELTQIKRHRGVKLRGGQKVR